MPMRPRPTASLKPATMKGSAAGRMMLAHSWRSLQRKARPTSSSSGADSLHALMRIDGDREEGEEEQHDDLGGELKARPQHDDRHQRHRRGRVEEGDIGSDGDLEYPEARQQQTDADAGHGGDGEPDDEHDQARPEIGPELAARDHLDRGGGDRGGRGEQDRIDARSDELPQAEHEQQRDQLDAENVAPATTATRGGDGG